jgi:hypothetical protein
MTDQGLAGQDSEEFFAGDGLRLTLVRPPRKDEKQPRPFPDWLPARRGRHLDPEDAPVKRCLTAYDHV